MSKFGALIDLNIPVLLDFYTDSNEQAVAMHPVLKEVAATLGNKAKVIKINVDKNKELVDALRIKGVPTLMIYKKGEMVWRHNGMQDANALIVRLKEHC